MIPFTPHIIVPSRTHYDYNYESSFAPMAVSGGTMSPVRVYMEKPEREQPKVIERIIIKEVSVPQKPEKEKEPMSITSFSSILTIVIVCIITVKFIIPRLSAKYLIWKFVGLVWKPAKKKAADIKDEWNAANNGA